MIKTQGIRFSYNSENSFSFPDINCEAGNTCLILGRSGVGKTTLLHLLGGLMPLQEGEVLINESSLNKMSGKKLDNFRGDNIGIVFQKPHFMQALTIRENLLLTQQLAHKKSDKKVVDQILEQLNILHRAGAYPNALSQGELQRASVARATLNHPKVILADEPTSALDDDSCHKVFELLQTSAKSLDAALLIVTHDERLKSIVDNKILLS